MSREKSFKRVFRQLLIPGICLYIYTQIHVCICKAHKYTHIYTYSKGIGIWVSALNLYNQFWPYCRQKGNPFTLLGHFSLPHTLSQQHHLTERWRRIESLLSLHSLQLTPSPALRTSFLGSVKFSIFKSLGYFETAPWGVGNRKKPWGEKGLQWLGGN